MNGGEVRRSADYAADWFDNPHLAHGGTYGVRGPKGLVIATSPFKAGWKKAQKLAAEMNDSSHNAQPDDAAEAPRFDGSPSDG